MVRYQTWEESGYLGSWSPRFSRHLYDWELREVEALFSKLQPLIVRKEVEDVMNRRDSKNGKFLVKSLYCFYTRAFREPFQ